MKPPPAFKFVRAFSPEAVAALVSRSLWFTPMPPAFTFVRTFSPAAVGALVSRSLWLMLAPPAFKFVLVLMIFLLFAFLSIDCWTALTKAIPSPKSGYIPRSRHVADFVEHSDFRGADVYSGSGPGAIRLIWPAISLIFGRLEVSHSAASKMPAWIPPARSAPL